MTTRVWIRSLLSVFLLLIPIGTWGEQACAPTKIGMIVRGETIPWPFDLAPGTGITLNVLSNDFDGRGGTLTITSPPVLSHPIGTVTLSADQRTIFFVPATPGTYPGDNRTITYTVTSSKGGAQTAQAVFARDPISVQSDFEAICQGRQCLFRAIPQLATARSFTWRFDGNGGCNKVEWRGLTTDCLFPVPTDGSGNPINQKTMPVTLEINYYSGLRDTVTKDVTWYKSDPKFSWDWWDARRPGEGTDGLAVAGWIHSCPTCVQICSGGPIDELYWDWGEDGYRFVPIRTQANCGSDPHFGYPEKVNHIYKNPGRYTVRALLKVGGVGTPVPYPAPTATTPSGGMVIEVKNKGATITLSRTVSVDDVNISASIQDDSMDPVTPHPSTIPTRIEWDFGDGSTAESIKPFDLSGTAVSESMAHRYAKKGTYVATVQSTDLHGTVTSAQTSEIVISNLRPEAKFTFSCTGLTCTFNGAGSKDDTSIQWYRWRFDPQGSFTYGSATMTHTFPTSGVRAVRLEVADNQGVWSDSFDREVTVTGENFAALGYYARRLPCRALDTRWGWESPWASGDTKQLIPANPNNCYVPGTAKAVAVNVTVVSAGGSGYLTAFSRPFDSGDLPKTSIINFNPAALPRSTMAVVEGVPFVVPTVAPASGNSSDAWVHVVIDVVGYYARPQDAGTLPCSASSSWCGPLDFRLLSQRRLVDTRLTGQTVPANTTRYLPLVGVEDVNPALNPMAIWLNATFVPKSTGVITFFDPSETWENAKNVAHTAWAGTRVHANSVVATVGIDSAQPQSTAVYSQYAISDVVLDAGGMFMRPVSPPAEMRFRAIQPCRAFDSRNPAQGGEGKILSRVPTQPYRLAFTGNCGVPQNAKAVVAYVTLVRPDSLGFLRVHATGSEMPPGTILNFQQGEVIGNTAVVPLGSDGAALFAPQLYSDNPNHGFDLVVDVYGYFAPYN